MIHAHMEGGGGEYTKTIKQIQLLCIPEHAQWKPSFVVWLRYYRA